MTGIQKALLIIFALSLFFLIWSFFFGGISSIYDLIFFGGAFIGIGVLFYAILVALKWYLAPSLFSPKQDWFNKTTNIALDFKPDNVNDLYFVGAKDRQKVRAGKITGMGGIPYLIGNPETDKEGHPIYEYSKVLDKKIPQYKNIYSGTEGDTLFVYESGWFLFKKTHYLRCHRKYHGDLHGDVLVYDINPVPYGNWLYPFRQWQEEQPRIEMQNMLEIIIATQEHQMDLISQGVDSAVEYNPAFRILRRSQAEMTGD